MLLQLPVEPTVEPAGNLIYTLPQKKSRALLPKLLSFLTLGFLFYAGILLNLYLLKLPPATESIVKISSLLFLIVIIFLGSFLSVRQARAPYLFYQDKIKHRQKQIYYWEIIHTSPKQDWLDKLFRTYSINLGKNFVLRNIPRQVQISNYLQQLIGYARRNQPPSATGASSA